MQFPTRILVLVRNRQRRRREPRTRLLGGRRGCGDGAAAGGGASASANGEEGGLKIEGAEVVFEISGGGEMGESKSVKSVELV